jgi:hypothetical protein
MNKETLEEAALRLYPIILEDDGWDKNKQYRDEWIEGAKWQQEQDKNKFSVEDMRLAFETGRNFQLTGENNFNELIGQLKKKKYGKTT